MPTLLYKHTHKFLKFKNENYDGTTNLNDIALLILTTEIELNNYTQIACLPQKSATYPGENIGRKNLF